MCCQLLGWTEWQSFLLLKSGVFKCPTACSKLPHMHSWTPLRPPRYVPTWALLSCFGAGGCLEPDWRCFGLSAELRGTGRPFATRTDHCQAPSPPAL